jgi:hypothetical protein
MYGDPTVSMRDCTERGEPLRFLHEEVIPYKGDNCLLWPYARDPGGYGRIAVNRINTHVHVVVCEIVNGPRPQDHVVSHKCGNGHLACVAPTHLKWQIKAEDYADQIIHGTVAVGSRHGSSKLTEKSVLEIRSLGNKLSQEEIAKKFNVSKVTISKIMQGKSWAWL